MASIRGVDGMGVRLGLLYAAHRLLLPSSILHRVLLGNRVGRGSTFGRGACVLARKLRIGNDVHIGAGSDVVADEIDIADGVVIGDNVSIRCKRLILGPGSRIDTRTHVYGVTTPGSALELGPRAWIFADCHINTDDRVTIGAGSAIGGRSLVFTHSSYLPITAGYPVNVAPVTIGECVWLPWQVFILPGATIEDGATVGACSLVTGTIPRNSLAVGVPAKVVKGESSFRRRYDDKGRIALARKVLDSACTNVVGGFRAQELFRPRARSVARESPDVWRLNRGGASLRVILTDFDSLTTPLPNDLQAGDVVVTSGSPFTPPAGVAWLDLTSLESSLPARQPALLTELRQALGNFGIRFEWLPLGYGPPPLPDAPVPNEARP
jgi:acetyltransferase-like isoleucine patch superfamily enzyme